MTRLLKAGTLLGRLPQNLIDKLFTAAQTGQAPARHVLFSAGDEGDGFYRIISGLIKVSVDSVAGGERVLAILGKGAVVGELAMIDGLPRSASAIVMEDAAYQFVSAEAFESFADANPDFYRELVLILATRLRETDKALAAATFLSVRGRVAHVLIDLADHLGRRLDSGVIMISHRISNGDIAAMAGVARENVSRLLGEWRDRGVVTQSDRFHHIHDLAALERELN